MEQEPRKIRCEAPISPVTMELCGWHFFLSSMMCDNKAGSYQPQRFTQFSVSRIFPNGTPLQSSCLENPMDGEAWWAAVHGVTKSRT